MSELTNIKVHLIEDWDDAQRFMTWLGERRPVLAGDLETEGIDPWRDKIRTCQFGDAVDGWVIPWHRWSGLVEEVVKQYEGRYVFHNGQFDWKFLEADGIELPYDRCHDTYILAHLLNPRRPLGLKPLSDKMISSVASQGEKLLKAHMKAAKVSWDTVAIDEVTYWAYGALDTIFTARLYEMMIQQVETGMLDLYEMERRVGIVLMRMQQKGIRLDSEYVEGERIKIATEIAEIEAQAFSEFGIDHIGSAMKVADRMMEDGWVPKIKTASGKPSLAKAVVETIDHPLAKLKVEHGKLVKLSSNYLKVFQEVVVDDRVHCEIRQMGAQTGRMSISRPSLQNLPAPRDGDLTSARIRNAFIADEGHLLCSIDYDQIELRIAADHSDSASLIEAFRTEPDMHSFMAGMMLKKPSEGVTKAERSAAKTVTFGKLFGAGVKTISAGLGVPMSEGKKFIDKYDQAFPELRTYMDHLAKEGQRLSNKYKTSPYVYTEYGRFQPTPWRTEYRLTNYRTQGTAADLLKLAIIDLDAAGFGEYMLIPIHDEVVFTFPEQDAEELMNEAMKIMEYPERKVPLTVGGSLGLRLGDVK